MVVTRARALAVRRERELRYLLAGGFNTAFGLTIYPLLLWTIMRGRPDSALLLSQAVSLVVAFTTYKLGVFRTNGFSFGELFRFSGFYVVNFAINWLFYLPLVKLLDLNPVVVQTIFVMLAVIASWFWHNRITFRSSRP